MRPPTPPDAPAQAEVATAPPAARRRPPGPPKPSLPKSGGARAALAAGLAVVVALILVLALSGGDDSGSPPSSPGETAAGSENVAAANPKLTQAVLSPIDGGDAKGLATFGRVKNSLALQIEAEGLAPTEKGQSYTIWLYESAAENAAAGLDRSPRAAARSAPRSKSRPKCSPTSPRKPSISSTSPCTDEATLKAALAKATEEKKAPTYTGTDVLRGTIAGPIIGAAPPV